MWRCLCLVLIALLAVPSYASTLRVHGVLEPVVGELSEDVHVFCCILRESSTNQQYVIDLSLDACQPYMEGVFDIVADHNDEQTRDLIYHATVVSLSPYARQKVTPLGVLNIAYIRVNYINENENTCSESCLESNTWTSTWSVNNMYMDTSYGQVSFDRSTSNITTVFVNKATTEYTGSGCSNDLTGIYNDAVAAAGIDASDFDHVSIISPAICGIGWGTIGGARTWIQSGHIDTYAHEFGHNFRMHHASVDSTDSRTLYQGSGGSNSIEYGDRSCVMGYSHVGSRGFNFPHRVLAGHTSAVLMGVPDPAQSHVFTIKALNLPAGESEYHGMILPRSPFGEYYISLRQPIGADANIQSQYLGKMNVHYVEASSSTRTFHVANVDVNSVFEASECGFRLTPIEVTSETMTIQYDPVSEAVDCPDGTRLCDIGATIEDCPPCDDEPRYCFMLGENQYRDFNNMCEYPDCPAPPGCNVADPSRLGNGVCDYYAWTEEDYYNTPECLYDGGDCCTPPCDGYGEERCGDNDFCIDPEEECNVLSLIDAGCLEETNGGDPYSEDILGHCIVTPITPECCGLRDALIEAGCLYGDEEDLGQSQHGNKLGNKQNEGGECLPLPFWGLSYPFSQACQPQEPECTDYEDAGRAWLASWVDYDVSWVTCRYVAENGYCDHPEFADEAELYCQETCGHCCECTHPYLFGCARDDDYLLKNLAEEHGYPREYASCAEAANRDLCAADELVAHYCPCSCQEDNPYYE